MKRPCARCGNMGKHVWRICADGNRKRWVCSACDVELNALVMRWAFGDTRELDIQQYRDRLIQEVSA